MSVIDPSSPQQHVAALRHGTVVDHLNAGTGLKALEVLGIPPDAAALLGIQLVSEKLGRKDILKIADLEITPEEIHKLALFGPHATVSFIRDFQVYRKVKVTLPDDIRGIVRCPNPNCVTNHEKVTTRFAVISRDRLITRCHYCERRVYEHELEVV